jgi:SanA protein
MFLFKLILLILGVALIGFTTPRLLTLWFASSRLYQPENVPPHRVVVVFGAGLWRDGTPSAVLRDRIATAAKLYFTGRTEKLLMSGDNSFGYNEPVAMRDYALGLGIPAQDIVLDYAGRRTYDTCLRAREIFQVDSAILVTQAFHLPRALYVCNQLGVRAVGVPADIREYRRFARIYWNLRETVATLVALWEVHISPPPLALEPPQPIFPREAQ